MWITKHIIIGILPALFVYLFSGNLIFVVLMYLSSVLIDFDHYISLVIVDRTWNPFYSYHMLKYKVPKMKRYEERLFCIFHTIEVQAAILISSFFYPILFFVFLGFAFHTLTDILTVARHKNKRIFTSTFHILRYLRRNKFMKTKILLGLSIIAVIFISGCCCSHSYGCCEDTIDDICKNVTGIPRHNNCHEKAVEYMKEKYDVLLEEKRSEGILVGTEYICSVLTPENEIYSQGFNGKAIAWCYIWVGDITFKDTFTYGCSRW